MPITAGLHKQYLPPPRPVEEEDEKPVTGESLPLVSVLDKGTMEAAKKLLTEAQELKARMDKESERLGEIKEALVGICSAFELAGLRWGQIGLVYNGLSSKRTLDKGLLLENGVTADQIKASYKEGKPYVNARFIKVP
jgi:hypothetical protein